jgi:hypothetical protein
MIDGRMAGRQSREGKVDGGCDRWVRNASKIIFYALIPHLPSNSNKKGNTIIIIPH